MGLRLDFDAKMASSHDGTCPCEVLQGLVPSCVPTSTVHRRMFLNDDYKEQWDINEVFLLLPSLPGDPQVFVSKFKCSKQEIAKVE